MQGFNLSAFVVALLTAIGACYYIQFVKLLSFDKLNVFSEKLLFLEAHSKSIFLAVINTLNIFFVNFSLFIHYGLLFIVL
jgi:hypothetical protein